MKVSLSGAASSLRIAAANAASRTALSHSDKRVRASRSLGRNLHTARKSFLAAFARPSAILCGCVVWRMSVLVLCAYHVYKIYIL